MSRDSVVAPGGLGTGESDPRRAVVLGGAGFLGSHLVDGLLSEGFSVTSIDNLCTGRKENFEHCLGLSHFEFIDCDIEEMRTDIQCDLMFNLASPASPEAYRRLPLETLSAGSAGVKRSLEAARKSGATYIFTSTSEVYGDPLEHPQREGYFGNVNPVGPRSMYDEAKRFGEALITAYADVHNLDVRIARLFNTYGPRMREDDGRVVPMFMKQVFDGEEMTVHGDGLQTRSLCYVTDTVRGLIRLADTAVASPVNIGNPEEVSILQLADIIAEAAGVSEPRVRFMGASPEDPRVRRPDIELARTMLGWKPEIGLREGIERTLMHFRQG